MDRDVIERHSAERKAQNATNDCSPNFWMLHRMLPKILICPCPANMTVAGAGGGGTAPTKGCGYVYGVYQVDQVFVAPQ